MSTERPELVAWRANARITRRLLDLCPDEAFDLKPGSGKTIRSNFVHIVGVRRMGLEHGPLKVPKAAVTLDWKTADRGDIEAALEESDRLVAEILALTPEPTKPSHWSPALMLAYLVAHEAHHRSQIEIALRIGGHPLRDEDSYSLWEWTKLSRAE